MNCKRNRPVERRPGRLLCKAHKHHRSDKREELRAYYVRGAVDSLDVRTLRLVSRELRREANVLCALSRLYWVSSEHTERLLARGRELGSWADRYLDQAREIAKLQGVGK